eukprot:5238562-Amphidinium_carterae.1
MIVMSSVLVRTVWTGSFIEAVTWPRVVVHELVPPNQQDCGLSRSMPQCMQGQAPLNTAWRGLY